MNRPEELYNLKQFSHGEVIRGVLEWECDFCGGSLLADDQATADYALELLESSGPATANELIGLISFDFHDGCCSHCSHILDD